MRTWDSEQLRTFLDWAGRERPELYPAWLLLAMTGMRRGEALAVRWGDVEFETSTLAVRRSAVLVKGEGGGAAAQGRPAEVRPVAGDRPGSADLGYVAGAPAQRGAPVPGLGP